MICLRQSVTKNRLLSLFFSNSGDYLTKINFFFKKVFSIFRSGDIFSWSCRYTYFQGGKISLLRWQPSLYQHCSTIKWKMFLNLIPSLQQIVFQSFRLLSWWDLLQSNWICCSWIWDCRATRFRCSVCFSTKPNASSNICFSGFYFNLIDVTR